METDPNKNKKKWYYQNKIQYLQDRGSVLLNLRYQLAFIIITILIAIWTVLGAIASQTINEKNPNPDFTIFVLWGCLLSVFILTMWRCVVHIIAVEENSYLIAQITFENKLGIFEEKEGTLFNEIQQNLKLDKKKEFNDLCPYHKIQVINQLKKYITNLGLLLFDIITILIIGMLIVIGTLFFGVAPDQAKSLFFSIFHLWIILIIVSVICIFLVYFGYIRPIIPLCQRINNAFSERYENWNKK